MNVLVKSVFAMLTVVGVACQDKSAVAPAPTTGVLLDAVFATSADGWEGEFTDYGTEQEDIIEFSFAHTALPSPLNTAEKALKVFGRNRSDDLFMFVRKQLTGLAPNTTYKLQFDVQLASLYPEASVGIGGSPATSVFLKAGASAVKPQKIKKDNFYTLNVDKGNQSSGGAQAVLLGHVANGKTIEEYALIQRSNKDQPLTARTNDKGELWIFIGTDSGFEGDQALYYSRIKVTAL